MSHEKPRSIPSSLLVLLVAVDGEGSAQVVIDPSRHHLGAAGRPEWREFAGSVPEGPALVRFDGRSNPAEASKS